jgi:recombination protein RecR
MNYPSKLVENAVNEIAKLPSIGKKTALRLVLHLLKQDEKFTQSLTEALNKLRNQITYCEDCHNISDTKVCNICANRLRDRSLVCIVEDTPDVIAIENTNQYNGLYHILGGVISPIEGISPNELNIESLVQRVSKNPEIKEVILAISATMEGDTTAFYLTKKLQPFAVKVTTLARGVPVGSELEYTDEVTLGRSILSRIKYGG